MSPRTGGRITGIEKHADLVIWLELSFGARIIKEKAGNWSRPFSLINGVDETRTRDLLRDRQAF